MVASLATPFRREARSHWGMSQENAERSYPGDALVPQPLWQWTHAVEVDAKPAAIWPWIAQLGQEKAGFYSYQLLENILGCEIHNADRIHTEWQTPRAGDELRLHPEMPALTVCDVVPEHHLLVAAGLDPAMGTAQLVPTDGQTFVRVSWLFALEALPNGRTRVVSRYRCLCSDDLKTRIMYGPFITEAIGFAMDRRMLIGIRDRVERPRPYTPP